MRILWIIDEVPYPPITGSPLRNYQLLRRLAHDHEVWVATLAKTAAEVEGIAHLREFCQRVEAMKMIPGGMFAHPVDWLRYVLAKIPPDLRLYHSSELIRKVEEFLTETDFDIIQIENSYMALYLETIPLHLRHKTILTFIDVVFDKYDRIYRLEPKPTRKLRLWLHSRMMRHWEPRYAERFGRCLAMSERDKQVLLTANSRLTIDVVPNGVDVRGYQPLSEGQTRPVLLFVGNMGYRPNVDAVGYLCRDILPRVRQVIADTELWIVGVNPGPEVRGLEGNGVHVTGQVEDVIPYYRESRACVVPLHAGGGTRLKILEAMALGRPVVSTSIGCEGLEVVNGQHLLIADDSDQFAECTIRLLTDKSLRQCLAENARRLVVSCYDWDRITEKLLQTYADLNGASYTD